MEPTTFLPIGLGLIVIGAAMGIGKFASAAAESLARQPEAAVKVMPGAYLSKPDNNNLNPGEKYIRVALVQEPAFVSQSLSRMVNTL